MDLIILPLNKTDTKSMHIVHSLPLFFIQFWGKKQIIVIGIKQKKWEKERNRVWLIGEGIKRKKRERKRNRLFIVKRRGI